MKMVEKKIYLIGYPIERLNTRKLPSIKEVLQLFLYKHINSNLTIRQCFNEVVADVMKIWELTGIPVRKSCHAISKIMKVHREWDLLKKNKKTKSQSQKMKELAFLNRGKELFDISSRNPERKLTEAQSKYLNEEWKTSNRHSIFLSSVNVEEVSKASTKSDLDVKPDDDFIGLSQSWSLGSYVDSLYN